MRSSRFPLVALVLTSWVAGVGCGGPASIEVEPADIRLTNAMRSQQLQVTVKDKGGKVLGGVAPTFRSLTPTLITVDGSGTVSALGSGSGTVLVAVGEVKKEVGVVIQLAKKIEIDPASPRLMLGVTRGFKATVYNDKDEPMMVMGKVRWTSADPSIFTVDDRGNVKTIKEGEAKLTAHAAGIAGSTSIEVRHEKLQEDGTLD